MVSEADIAEARRKALRNGEEDPLTVAQRYLNVYRQMHIFSQERKDEFDKSLLNLSPIIITVISSLPGGLTFQDYIDEVLSKAGREKSARDNTESEDSKAPSQPQILSNAQANMQPQQIVAPVMSGEAKLSMGKEFADEFAKIMTGIVAKQTIMQKDSLAKVAQDLGKTQLFIAKKLEDNKAERQAEMNELCKAIAQSHTALSTSLATLGENFANQKQENSLVPIPSVERSPEDDVRLVEMITQSQERMMSGLLARLPQAVGVGNVNVTAASRSVDDDVRLAEMIAQSQEKVLSKLLERIPQVTGSALNASTPVYTPQSSGSSANLEEMMALMTKSQEKLIATLAEKLPQMSAGITAAPVVSATRSADDDERLVEMITKSQEKLISSLIDRIPSAESKTNTSSELPHRTQDDDERLIRLITTSQESMIKSLIEKNVFAPQVYPQNPPPVYNTYTPSNDTSNNTQYYQPETSVNNVPNSQPDNNYPSYIPTQNVEEYNNDVDFSMFTPAEDVGDVSSILYDEATSSSVAETYEAPNVESLYQQTPAVVEETVPETKKKKKKKKKKKSNNNDEVSSISESQNFDDDISFTDISADETPELSFDDIGEQQFDNSSTNNSELDFDNMDEAEEKVTEEIIYDDTDIKDFEDDFLETAKEQESDVEELETSKEEQAEDKFDETLLEEDDSDDDFDNKWLDFEDDEDIETEVKVEKWTEEDSSTKADWGLDNEDDSWGFESAKEDNKPSDDEGWEYVEVDDSEEGWEYVEDDGSEEGWEYVEDDGSEEGWEYVEDDGQYSDNQNWEYVESIDDNSKIYSSDSYSQQKASVENIVNKTSKIHITNVPQIYDETIDEEIDDPYKNSILKD